MKKIDQTLLSPIYQKIELLVLLLLLLLLLLFCISIMFSIRAIILLYIMFINNGNI